MEFLSRNFHSPLADSAQAAYLMIACRSFGIGRVSSYRSKAALQTHEHLVLRLLELCHRNEALATAQAEQQRADAEAQQKAEAEMVKRKADEEAGEVPKAYVVLKADDVSRATTGDAIMGWVAGRVAPHKRIRHLEFIDQIPKSASGKILRRMLRDNP